MSARKECPFCGNPHLKVEKNREGANIRKAFVECPRCKCRGPLVEQVAPQVVSLINEAVARWDDRRAAT